MNRILLAFSALVLFACGSEPKTETETKAPAADDNGKWKVSSQNFMATEGDCKEPCTYINLEIPKLEGEDQAVADAVNGEIDALCREMIEGQLPEKAGNAPYEQLCLNFIDGFDLFMMEFPDSDEKWSFDLMGGESAVGENYFSMNLNTESYMGGAHPNRLILLKSYDLKTGERVDITNLFNQEVLMAQAEKKFREEHELDAQASLNDAGFMFEEGVFNLPQNMALTAEGLLLIYNNYEVASYAEGLTVFVLPYELLDEKIVF